MEEILRYVHENIDRMERGGIASNQIRYFTYKGKKCVAKTPLMVGDALSPFWKMLGNLFSFTFEKQLPLLPGISRLLAANPHIPGVPLLAVDEGAAVYEFAEGRPWTEDTFPAGENNACLLGQSVGFLHGTMHDSCGLYGHEDVPDFYAAAAASMEKHIGEYWNGDDAVCRNVRIFCDRLRRQSFTSSRFILMMADQSADQYLYDEKGNLLVCVDMDAYVVAPAEWELTLLHHQVTDWASFRRGYEHYLPLPDFRLQSDYFTFLMNLNAPWDKESMAAFLQNKI